MLGFHRRISGANRSRAGQFLRSGSAYIRGAGQFLTIVNPLAGRIAADIKKCEELYKGEDILVEQSQNHLPGYACPPSTLTEIQPVPIL
jgi:hypothetical protein